MRAFKGFFVALFLPLIFVSGHSYAQECTKPYDTLVQEILCKIDEAPNSPTIPVSDPKTPLSPTLRPASPHLELLYNDFKKLELPSFGMGGNSKGQIQY